jgi:hypothetical protein
MRQYRAIYFGHPHNGGASDAHVPTVLVNEDEEETQAGRKEETQAGRKEETQAGRKKKTKQTLVSVLNDQHRPPDDDEGHRNRCTTQAFGRA